MPSPDGSPESWLRLIATVGLSGSLLIFVMWWLFRVFIPGVLKRFDDGLTLFQAQMTRQQDMCALELKAQREDFARELKALRDTHTIETTEFRKTLENEREIDRTARHANAQQLTRSMEAIQKAFFEGKK